MTFAPRVAFNVRDAQGVAIVASALCQVRDGRLRGAIASLAIFCGASISRAAADTFRIFKMLVDDELWPLTNIVKFADEFRPIATAKDCYKMDRKSFLAPAKRCEPIESQRT